MKRKFKKVLRKIISVLGTLALIGLVIALVRGNNKVDEDGMTNASITWSVGSIDENGKFVDTKKALYSSSFECNGLEVTLDFDANLTYEIFYYDEAGSLIVTSGKLTEGYKIADDEALTEADVVEARIVITPNLEDGKEVNFVNKFLYSSELTVRVLDDQTNTKPVE